MGTVTKPVTGPMSFDACMARDWPGIEDKAAFCATLERGEIALGAVKIDLAKCLTQSPKSSKLRLEIIAKNEEQRLVTAWASVVSKDNGDPIIDAQGDIIKIGDLEAAVNRSFAEGGKERGRVMHEGKSKADIVQFFTLSKSEREALGFGPGREGLIVKFQVHDDLVWQAVKEGLLPELSIGGSGEREPV